MRDGSTKFPTNEAHPWRRVALIDSSGFRFADLPCHANQNSSDIRLDNVNNQNQAKVYLHDKCNCFKCAKYSEFGSAGYGKSEGGLQNTHPCVIRIRPSALPVMLSSRQSQLQS